MPDQSKRVFLKGAALTMAGLPLVSSSFVVTPASDTMSTMAKEFHAVYLAWLRAESIDPVSYLRSRGLSSIADKVSIRNLSRQDFACGNTIYINGFVLSKAEAAVIASMGKTAVIA